LAVAKQTILSESESITKLIDLLDENFADAQEIYLERQISSNRHRKSAIIAQKNGPHLTLRNTITVSSRI
jgi:arabinose-5-phosphate isomerase